MLCRSSTDEAKHLAFICWWTRKSGQSSISSQTATISADETLWLHVDCGVHTETQEREAEHISTLSSDVIGVTGHISTAVSLSAVLF